MSTVNRVSFEEKVANKFLSKKRNAAERNIEFTLSLTSVANLMKAKRCYYTGVILTEPDPKRGYNRASDRTIDRVDSSKGYVKGNVVACSHAANQLKSFCEGAGIQGFEMGVKVFERTMKRMEVK